jgi:hypothetical protein
LNATWPFLAGLLAGWILGVWMSHRKIQRTRRANLGALTKLVGQLQELRITLGEDEVVDITTEEGQKRILETIQGKTKH